MPVVLDDLWWVAGAMLLVVGLVLLAVMRAVTRWKRSMNVSDDAQYVETLATLSRGFCAPPLQSVYRH